jgi:Flp pilus assembly protein TadD
MRTLKAFLLGAACSMAFGAPVLAIPEEKDAPSETAGQFQGANDFQAGLAAYEAGDFQAAADIFTAVASASGYKDAVALTYLGKARIGLNDNLRAGLAFRSAMDADPDYLPAYEELAVQQAASGDADAAEYTLEQLQAKAAACADACTNVEDLGASVARVRAAIDGDSTASLPSKLIFASAETGDAAYMDAVALVNSGDYQGALARLKMARQAFGPHPDVLTYLGFVNRKLGNFEAAESYYQQALASQPDHRGAMEYYGELKVVRGDFEGAQTLLARLEQACVYGCAEADELRRWIDGERSSDS